MPVGRNGNSEARRAWIGLGSSLGDRREHLRAGAEALRALGVGDPALSSVWETEPVDAPSSGRFLNAVARLRCALEPAELLEALHRIEADRGRDRPYPNAPRTLDLDLLLLEGVRRARPGLTVPHPRMWERAFVLAPLAELDPGLRRRETGRTVTEELRALPDRDAVRRIGPLL